MRFERIVRRALFPNAWRRQTARHQTSRLPPVILSASEGSRCVPIVAHKLVNTGRREGTLDDIPERGGERRLRRPGSSRHWAHALDYGQAVRCSLNGQAMLAYEPDLRFLCRNRTSSAHRAGWFRGSYICCLSAAVVDAFKNERRHDDKTGEPPCGRSPVVWFSIPRGCKIPCVN